MTDAASTERAPAQSNGARPNAVPARDEATARRQQAERILERNRKLVRGTPASSSGEESVGVGHTVTSDRSHAGGSYSND